ncbi:hypothetical protein C8R44DRAFT_865429 [Mycena epipterygia]|nr:hypothetical protein C8R44DRAFT_865429 [Mycena epipterygia]
MPRIPQELLDAVVCELDDSESLKACSLAGSVLRDTSQRILLCSLTLGPGRWPNASSYGAACTLLSESSQIAAYITNLNLWLQAEDEAEVNSLRQVLAKLGNVRRCIVDGGQAAESAQHLPTVVEFVSRQVLRELHVHALDIPPALVLRFVTAAPVVSFFFVNVLATDEAPLLVPSSSHTLHKLLLEADSQDICDVLAHPQCTSYTTQLRCLSIRAYYPHAISIIQSAATTLQNIRLDCAGPAEPWSLPLPALPALHSAELSLTFRDRVAPWFSAIVMCLLSAPCLAELTVVFSPIALGYYRPPHAALLPGIDDSAAAAPARPRIRWRVDFNIHGSARDVYFTDFVRMLHRGMPRTLASGQLVVEEYVHQPGYVNGLLPYAVQVAR